jgi:hypothetical protein
MDLNHDNQMGARADPIRDQALPAGRHIGVAPTLLDSGPDNPGGEIGTTLPFCLILSTRMTQRCPRQSDSPARSIGCVPDDGAEPPMLVMDPALSIDPHRSRLEGAWDELSNTEPSPSFVRYCQPCPTLASARS